MVSVYQNQPNICHTQSFNFVISVGGLGGFLDSVLDRGVVHPPGIKVSEELAVLGGAGGSLGSLGGATNPASSVPSPAKAIIGISVKKSLAFILT